MDKTTNDKPNNATRQAADDYEPYGDRWKKEVMKLTKSQIVDMLRDECMERRMPTTYPK